jgi:hypothetical protein
VPDCTALSPSRLNSPADGYFCVDFCPDSYFNDGGTCVADCPISRPYLNASGSTGTCVPDCTALSPSRLNSQADGYFCVDVCPDSYYNDDGTCASECSDGRPYLNPSGNTGACVADCATLTPPRVNSQADGYYCVDVCKDSHYTVDGICVATCPISRPYVNASGGVGACVADCTALSPSRLNSRADGYYCVDVCNDGYYDDDGTCASECSDGRPYLNPSGNSGTCVEDCRLLTPSRFNHPDSHAPVCVDSCRTVDGYYLEASGNCSYQCEVSNGYRDDKSGRCVRDCRALTPPRVNANFSGPQCVDVCPSAYALNGVCLPSCPIGFTEDLATNRCVSQCGAHCAVCTSSGTCAACEAASDPRYYAYDGTCSETCADRWMYIQNDVGVCVGECPDGTYRFREERCNSCHPSCLTCAGSSATSCTACDPLTHYLTLNHRCAPYRLPGDGCDVSAHPMSEDCASDCRGGVCCAVAVPRHCMSCARGTGVCEMCDDGFAPYHGLCRSLISENFSSTTPETAVPGFTVWAPYKVSERDSVDNGVVPLRLLCGLALTGLLHLL